MSTGIFPAVIGGGSGGVVTIPEYSSDPSSPVAQQAWVLRSGMPGNPGGVPMGLLLALTYPNIPGIPYTYQFSYYTNEGTTIRTTLS